MNTNKNNKKKPASNEDTRDLRKTFIKNKTKDRQREKKYLKDVEDVGYDELDNFEKW
jgi:hypothetical protein